jgi:hypothetical protein
MFQFLRGIALTIALMANFGAAFAEQRSLSANDMMPHCHEWFKQSNKDALFQGICFGMAVGDDRPARLHEDFRVLALEALQAAWPCKQ